MTTFIGKNDVGKSTIFEALEIFFNNKLVVADNDDFCVHSKSDVFTISCEFSNLPDQIVIDENVSTTLVFCKTFLHNIAKKKYTPLRLKFFSDYCGFDRAFLSR